MCVCLRLCSYVVVVFDVVVCIRMLFVWLVCVIVIVVFVVVFVCFCL